MRITEEMTNAEIESLSGFERVRGHLMRCRPSSRAKFLATTLADVRRGCGNVLADRMLCGLRRLDEVILELGEQAIEARPKSQDQSVDVRLFRFPGREGAPFVLVCAGGGYQSVCNAQEAFPVAAALNKAGYHAFVLSYRIQEAALMPEPIGDVAWALQFVEAHAHEWGCSSSYALMGFSAGAHLVSELCTDNWGWERWGLAGPEALILCYPAVDLVSIAHVAPDRIVCEKMLEAALGSQFSSECLHEFSVVEHLSPACPPVFAWQAADDTTIPISGLYALGERMSEQGIAHELRVYERGDHGLVMPHDAVADGWEQDVMNFLDRHLPLR